MFGFAKRFLQFLGSTSDVQRFGEWKNNLEDALKELEKGYKKKKISKKAYLQQKAILEERLKKAGELIRKSQESLEKAKHHEIRL